MVSFMILKTERNNDQVLVWLSGVIDVDVATSVREELFSMIAEGCRLFVIHLDDVQHMDSSGLGVLVAVQKRVGPRNLILKGLKGEIQRLVGTAKLIQLFDAK